MAAIWRRRRFLFVALIAAVALVAGGPGAYASAGGRPRPVTGTSATGDHEPAQYIPAGQRSVRAHASHYADAGVLNYGQAGFFGAPTNVNVPAPVVAMAATRSGGGYWLAAADGAVFAYGDALYYGGMQRQNLHGPIEGIVASPSGRGYWLYSQDGGVFGFGDARFYGSMGGARLGSPIVGMAADAATGGYWLEAEGGGIFSFHAPFYGSRGGANDGAFTSMASTPSGRGYMLVTGAGGLFNYGDAPFDGSLGNQSFSAWIASVAVDRSDGGYWMAGADGKVYKFGDAPLYGSAYTSATSAVFPVAQIVANPTSTGYWLLEPDAFPTVYSDPPTNSTIVDIASNQIQADPDSGYFCNPYGPCEAWCALFATWVWQQAGVPIPQYGFVGYVYDWAASHTGVRAPNATPVPGDAVLYGTGPQSVDTAWHMGIVAQVWPSGAIDTIEGDAGPANDGYLSVIQNGPFLPGDSDNYNGMPIFGFAVP